MASRRPNPFAGLRRGSDASSLHEPHGQARRHTARERDADAADAAGCCSGLGLSMERVMGPVDVEAILARDASRNPFFMGPILGPLLVPNETSDARDHCANERTFLSYVKLSMYITIVAVTIVLSFHLKSEPSELELRIATPLGAIFWVLSLAVLLVGLANYIETLNKYGKKAALVQTGWGTQLVIGMVGACVMGTCVALLVIESIDENEDAATGLLAMLDG
ncbi:hypothetical protein BROUX41_005999 [Berkeleyomyces rouxiae]|uniref:uncharacterized protein n=1 Tax=Berkeleyomyces rouxiae TaxID=2035830 RepID=UPI003B7BA794